MTSTIKQYLAKTIGSRKFMAAVMASLPFALASDWVNFAMVWMAYAGIEGVVDATGAIGTKRTSISTGAIEMISTIDEVTAAKIGEGIRKSPI